MLEHFASNTGRNTLHETGMVFRLVNKKVCLRRNCIKHETVHCKQKHFLKKYTTKFTCRLFNSKVSSSSFSAGLHTDNKFEFSKEAKYVMLVTLTRQILSLLWQL